MRNLCVFCAFSTFAQKIFKWWGCNFTWSFFFDQKSFSYCWDNFDFPGSIVYLSCSCFFSTSPHENFPIPFLFEQSLASLDTSLKLIMGYTRSPFCQFFLHFWCFWPILILPNTFLRKLHFHLPNRGCNCPFRDLQDIWLF